MSSSPKMEMGRAIIAAAYIAVGIILISHPGVTGIIICRTAGGLALLLGGFRVFTALRARGADWFFQLDLIVGVLLLAFGIFALAQPKVVLSVLPVVLGVYLVTECVGKIQRALLLKKGGYPRWWTALSLGPLTGLLGVLLIVNPFQAVETSLMLLGISLVVNGASDLWILWCFASQSGREKSGQ
ncbi:MAG: hypothetical protein HFF73_14210 [Oscillospiraceae bacterium]|nr:hypothetical protein [Oscillospiraceae bacterium]